MSHDNTAIVRRLFDDVWNGRRPELIPDLYAPDWVGQFSDTTWRGIDGARQLYSTFTTGFPNLRLEVLDLIGAAATVASRVRYTGNHVGAFGGFPPSGDPVSLELISFHRIRDDKIVKEWSAWDTLRFAQQLGALHRLKES